MKRLLILIILLPLILWVRVTRTTAAELDDGVVVVSTTTTEMPLMGLVSSNATCKTQSHRFSFQSNGVEFAWTKLTGTSACWGPLGVKLGDSTRSHGATSPWYWVWGAKLLGGRGWGTTPITRYANDDLHNTKNKNGYITYHALHLYRTESLDFNWEIHKTPVVWP